MNNFVDRAVAALLLLVLAPAFIVIAVIVAIDQRTPAVFFRARRVGRGGRPFEVLKFRKMRDADGPAVTANGDDRFTSVGTVLAKLKLDELPQLINVARGDMALVGPRPEDARFVEMHPDTYGRILDVRPGITGPAQLAYARESAILDGSDPERDYVDRVLPRKLEIDLLYAREKCSRLDLRFCWWTLVATVVRREVAVDRSTLRCTLRAPRRPQEHPEVVASRSPVPALSAILGDPLAPAHGGRRRRGLPASVERTHHRPKPAGLHLSVTAASEPHAPVASRE